MIIPIFFNPKTLSLNRLFRLLINFSNFLYHTDLSSIVLHSLCTEWFLWNKWKLPKTAKCITSIQRFCVCSICISISIECIYFFLGVVRNRSWACPTKIIRRFLSKVTIASFNDFCWWFLSWEIIIIQIILFSFHDLKLVESCNAHKCSCVHRFRNGHFISKISIA